MAVVLLLTPAVVYVPANSLAQAGNDGTVGNDDLVGNDAPVRPEKPLPPVVGARRPTDPNGDGRFEDVNGDGTFDVVDSQALLAHLANESVRNHTVRYDFTADGVADVSDVQWLYVRAVQPTSADPDGDGLNNSLEIELGTNAFAADTDDDGLTDPVETNGGNEVDTDGDGRIDARDRDSDGDGATDAREGDADTDGDGVPDYRDADDDGDGIPTAVEVSDGANYTHDVDFDDTPNWLDTDADGDGIPDGTEGRADTDDDGMPAYLDNDQDNDGLPDYYERNVTGTAPGNNDSHTGLVNYETANNGVIDGMEDFDADTLGNYREYTLGTDPLDNDTDGDGLTDGFENRHRAFDPLVADSDSDGVADGEADSDDDGLTNAAEDDHGTLVDRADTDRDTLLDGREVDLGTDPTRPDTDDDGLDDPTELALGTDPLVADTDGDGVLDGNETFETTATEPETGTTVDVRGSGNLSASVRVTPKETFFDGVGARAGPTVRITNRSAFENATVSLPVDDAVSESDYDSLAVYTWNGSANDTWTPLETTVENGTARATVDHFSYFTVLDTDEWVNATSLDVGEPISFNETNVTACADACEIRNGTTAILGGEPTARQIRIEQGDRTVEVVPLSNGQSIERFYDYGNAEINSPLPIAKSYTSRLFFWSGPNGLSLVVLHDEPRDGSGAAVSFEFDGLPTRQGSWVVQDDGNDFRRSGGATSPDWTWNNDNTDGGAFRAGLTNATITIQPKFNEEADVNPLTPGSIDRWEVLTGRATDPRNESIALDENVTIRVPDDPGGDGGGGTAGDAGRLDFSTNLANGTEDVQVVYQTEQTDVTPSATLTITGPEGAQVTRSLSIGTVGTVSETVDVSSLAAGNTSVSLSADGVNLRAQLIARSSFDTDDDGIPDDIEERTWTLPTGPADTFSTDPRDNDTDGDGIPDGEEVEFTREVVNGELRTTPAVVRSNPDAVDSDDDGLTDLEERRGWNTYLARSAEQGDRFAEAREGDGNATAVLFEQNVSSDPLRADADGDRLDDTQERIAGTNPGVADSDGDGIPDGEEVLDDERGDPSIHDHTAPAVEPLSLTTNNVQRTSYTISIAVTDQSGFTTVNFYKKGERQRQLTEISETAETYRNLVITVEQPVSAVDAYFDPVTGDPIVGDELLPDSTGGNTPMPGALDLARKILNDDTLSGVRGPDVQKKIVLVTDGAPNYLYNRDENGISYTVDYNGTSITSEVFTEGQTTEADDDDGGIPGPDPFDGPDDFSDSAQPGDVSSDEERYETWQIATEGTQWPNSNGTTTEFNPINGDTTNDVTGIEILTAGIADSTTAFGSALDSYLQMYIAASPSNFYNTDFTADLQATAEQIARDVAAGGAGGEEYIFRGETLRDAIDMLTDGNGIPLDGDRTTDGRQCFDASATHCFGFSWWLPLDHGNEVQSDSASFDLGFYTEQCRHNDGSGMNNANVQEGETDA